MSFLDKVFASFDEREAVQERDRALERMQKAEAEVNLAMSQLEDAQREFVTINETITAWERWSGQSLTPEEAEVSHTGNGGEGTGGRAAIRTLLAAHSRHREWTTPSVAEAMGLGKEHHHAIQVHLSRMARDGELLRPRKGVYRLLPEGRSPEGEGTRDGFTSATPGDGPR